MSRILALFMIFSPAALALDTPKSCLPEFTSLRTVFESDPAQPRVYDFPLLSENGSRRFVTRARLHAEPSATLTGAYDMVVRFDPDFDGVSLAYTLMAVQVIVNGEVTLWMDYTRECRGPGLSFFPGGVVRLPALKLAPAHVDRVQIIVWGRL